MLPLHNPMLFRQESPKMPSQILIYIVLSLTECAWKYCSNALAAPVIKHPMCVEWSLRVQLIDYNILTCHRNNHVQQFRTYIKNWEKNYHYFNIELHNNEFLFPIKCFRACVNAEMQISLAWNLCTNSCLSPPK